MGRTQRKDRKDKIRTGGYVVSPASCCFTKWVITPPISSSPLPSRASTHLLSSMEPSACIGCWGTGCYGRGTPTVGEALPPCSPGNLEHAERRKGFRGLQRHAEPARGTLTSMAQVPQGRCGHVGSKFSQMTPGPGWPVEFSLFLPFISFFSVSHFVSLSLIFFLLKMR
jgi:hypothetical protein